MTLVSDYYLSETLSILELSTNIVPFNSIRRMDCTNILENSSVIEVVTPGFIRLYEKRLSTVTCEPDGSFFVSADYVVRKVRIIDPCNHRTSVYLNCIRHKHIHSSIDEIWLRRSLS